MQGRRFCMVLRCQVYGLKFKRNQGYEFSKLVMQYSGMTAAASMLKAYSQRSRDKAFKH